MEDVIVIGAGLSGLTAARRLHQAGYRVVVVDKSRGLGGRLATRRRGATAIDHGCRYLQPSGDNSAFSPFAALLATGDLQPWQPEVFELQSDGSLTATMPTTLYVAPQGMSAVAKTMAAELRIQRHWLANTLTALPQGWRVEGKSLGEAQTDLQVFEAKAVIVAIPAPQAAVLMGTAAQSHAGLNELCHRLQAVDFEAVITVMAGYSSDKAANLSIQKGTGGWMVASDTHSTLRWLALDSSKRPTLQESVVVLHSSAAFATEALDRDDLEPVGKTLLTEAASLGAWIEAPEWMQVHRWRYGFVRRALGASILSSLEVPNQVGCGDWCQGGKAEGAIASGTEAATAIAQTLG